jgi:hypothetical protein
MDSGRPVGSPGVNRATSSLSRSFRRSDSRAGLLSGRSQAAGSAYRAHDAMLPIAGSRWLDQLAGAPLGPAPLLLEALQ